MSKVLLFVFLTWLTGNPFIAIIVLLVILYALDRRFVGLTPSFMKPLRRSSQLRKLKRHIALAPNDTSSKQEAARILIEKKKYREALEMLEPMERMLEDSAEYWDDLGLCCLELGQLERGEAAIHKALEINPRVKYGAPYLRLASYYSKNNREKALAYIASFQDIQSSSCEAFERLAAIYKLMDRKQDTAEAIEEGLRVYRALPRYKKRTERKWAIRLLIKRIAG
ncbi:tetratricopeptide repeat protein [Paenibacillus gorillae]|uniref:tetratricopeptide repeat protein n=1 Tax=Paenibacillus gorillae TaxID=1243662 RepID=UPI0004AE5E5C|nr:hypothetical protein [Paenibacillus gorillae]